RPSTTARAALRGHFHINKVPGTSTSPLTPWMFNPTSTTLPTRSRGLLRSKIKKISSKNIGTFNSLSGRDARESGSLDSHEYVMKIVPTTMRASGEPSYWPISTHMPIGATFLLDMEDGSCRHLDPSSIDHFLTTVCAIVEEHSQWLGSLIPAHYSLHRTL
ncbi:Endoplasmic reticulum-Golgi intermediate compartment protein 1, partial [Caligus rogercresseyi]